eukprot:NODE_114_length_18474_cov_1.567510.p4 type:complete len:727 gc:universal NODE_114_length_18474_cov_1.567510:8603-10783(+)
MTLSHCALHQKFSGVCFYCIMRLSDPEKTNQLTSNLQQLHTQSPDIQLNWLNAIKQSVESMHSTVFMRWLSSCYLIESCFEMLKYRRAICFALDIIDDFVVLLPGTQLTKLCLTHFNSLVHLAGSENVTIRASICRLMYSIGIHLVAFESVDGAKLINTLFSILRKQNFKIQGFERDIILPMSTEDELQRYIPRYVQIMHENCMMAIGMVVYGRDHNVAHNHLLISKLPRIGMQMLRFVQEKRPICYPESQKADTAACILGCLLQLPLYDEIEDFEDEDWTHSFAILDKICDDEFLKQVQISVKSLLSDTPENLEKILKKVSRKKHRAPKIPDEEDHAKAVESTQRALISLVSIFSNVSFFPDLVPRMLFAVPTLLYIAKDRHIPKGQPCFYSNILNDLCLTKGVHRDPNFLPHKFLLNSFSPPLKETCFLGLLRVRKWMCAVSPDSADTGSPLPEVSNPPFSDIPLELWSPDTAYFLYQQAKQLSMTCRRRGNFAFADKDFNYAACQYSSALLLTSFEEEDLLITIPEVKVKQETMLELLPPLLYYKAKRIADRFIFKTNRAECWLRIKGMHDRANLDASNAIEEINILCYELSEMYPIESLMPDFKSGDDNDQLIYRSMLVSDDLWEKNERRIKRAEECFQLEKRQEQEYFNSIRNIRSDNDDYSEESGDTDFSEDRQNYEKFVREDHFMNENAQFEEIKRITRSIDKNGKITTMQIVQKVEKK